MTIKIRGKGKNKLKLEFEDEGFSLVNLLRHKIWDLNPDIDKAEYEKSHAYLDNLRLLVETKDSDPVEEVVKAAEEIKAECDDLIKEAKGL